MPCPMSHGYIKLLNKKEGILREGECTKLEAQDNILTTRSTIHPKKNLNCNDRCIKLDCSANKNLFDLPNCQAEL